MMQRYLRGTWPALLCLILFSAQAVAGSSENPPGENVGEKEILNHPLTEAFEAAAKEFNVPAHWLKAIAYAESRWSQRDGRPSIDQAYGVMGLRENDQTHTLSEAVARLGLSPDILKHDAWANIRGAASVLSDYARQGGPVALDRSERWAEAVAHYGGMADVVARVEYISQILDYLAAGVQESTPEGLIVLAPVPVRREDLRFLWEQVDDVILTSSDYDGARWNPACSTNQTASNRPVSYPINYVIIHDTEGSYAGAISWFRNCASRVSAHYVTRSSDGDMTQMVRHKDIGWHAGNWTYNTQSIGIEHEGYAAQGQRWYTAKMYQASANLTSYLCDLYGIPRDRSRIIGHVEVPRATHRDPGPFWDWESYLYLVNGAILVDNTQPGFAASASWTLSTNVAGYYAQDYRVRRTEGLSDPARWSFVIPEAGDYDVYARWSSASDRSTAAPYFIHHNGVTDIVYIDQSADGGAWVYLGTFDFYQGSDQYILLSCWTTPGFYVVADAVMLVRSDL